jgi:flagellar basal-body rod protein FlgG
MIRSLFVAKTGLDAQQTSLDIIANNLANASTTGYKRYKGVFEDMLYQTMRSAGTRTDGDNVAPTGLQMGTGSRAAASQPIFTQGVLQRTGNPLDLAIDGNGFFEIALGASLRGYTRDGNFTKDGGGRLVTSMGYVVQPEITIPPDATSVNISASGEVTVTRAGTVEAIPVGSVNTTAFPNPGGLSPIGGNIYIRTAASGEPASGFANVEGRGALKQFYTEGSNVNVAEELISMIQAQRAYEINTRSIRASDEVLQKLTSL